MSEKPEALLFSELTAAAPAVEESRGEATITALAYDSRAVEPGALFVATGGVGHDALAYLSHALEMGAAAVVAPTPPPAGVDVAWAVSSRPRLALAQLAAAWFGRPAEKLRLIGVTGTNGKTTTAHLIAAVLRAAGRRTAQFGTTGYYIDDDWEEAVWTTPEPLKLNELLRSAVDAGVEDVMMEVTSHALDQERTAGLRFAAAGFTNLTPEHLDYHQRLEGYFFTKARLFQQLEPAAPALLNADDEWVRRTAVPAGRRLLYGRGSEAELRAEDVRLGERSLSLRAVHGDWELGLSAPLAGAYDVYNVLLAVGICRGLGVTDEALVRGLAELSQIPGRFQFLEVGADFNVIVDYAHTPDGLTKALGAARRFTPGRLIIVFGSAGERDAAKRPQMGRAAAELADLVILTTEDPRREDPAQIARQIAAGVDNPACEVRTVLDRRAAVHAALDVARSGDSVIVAGKGDENLLKFADHTVHSNDIDLCLEFFGLSRRQAGVDTPRRPPTD